MIPDQMCLRPLAKQAALLAMHYASTPTLNEDPRVGRTRRPLRSVLQMGEHVIPDGGASVPYRRHRRELIELAECTARAAAARPGRAGEAMMPDEEPE